MSMWKRRLAKERNKKLTWEQRKQSIQYTINHRRAFRAIEKELLGHNTLRGILHDFDKIVLKLFIDPMTVHEFHTAHSRHHLLKARTHKDYVQLIIDWECARFTKLDKPMNAYDFLINCKPEEKEKILPIIQELDIVNPCREECHWTVEKMNGEEISFCTRDYTEHSNYQCLETLANYLKCPLCIGAKQPNTIPTSNINFLLSIKIPENNMELSHFIMTYLFSI